MYMAPVTTNEPFVKILFVESDEEHWAPSDAGPWDVDETVLQEVSGSWFARLSADGTMDATDWQGPYKSEKAALYGLWDFYGHTDESFFSFIGESVYIVRGSLALHGSRNELYGQPAEAEKGACIWLATMGDQADVIGTDEPMDPNDEYDLPEAYGFETVSAERATKLRQRALVYKQAYDQEMED